jgi:hypothetical protein
MSQASSRYRLHAWHHQPTKPSRRGTGLLRLSATVTFKFFLLYHFSSLFFSIFSSLAAVLLNTPPIPHYHYKISFSIPTINFLSTNNYSWTHSTMFRVMNSDTLDLGGERREPTCRGTACKGRGRGSGNRCAQPYPMFSRLFCCPPMLELCLVPIPNRL